MSQKLIIFDLDGVLIDSKDYHFEALNRALGPKYKINFHSQAVKLEFIHLLGNQNYVRKNCGLDVNSISLRIEQLVK